MHVVLITVIQALFFSLFKISGLEKLGGIVFVACNALLILCWGAASKETRTFLIWILIALVSRETLLLADYFHLFPLPHSGADSEVFAGIAEKNFQIGGYYSVLTHYTDFLSTLYFITGPISLIAQQVNVAFGMGTLFVCLQIFNELSFTTKQKKIGIAFLALFPHFCIFSAILLRRLRCISFWRFPHSFLFVG